MILQLQSVSKTYLSPGGQVEALREVSLELGRGDFVALRGSSGSGKSTLLLAAGGLLEPDRGQVSVDGHDLFAMSPDQRARYRAAHIGFVFQQFYLVPYLNVLENVLTATLGNNGAAGGDATARARDLIAQLNLESRIRHRPGQLSTGERQRTALARALLNRPRLLLADEPTGNLDEENARNVLEHLQAFAGDGGAVLLVTHEERAARFARTSYAMTDGQLTVL